MNVTVRTRGGHVTVGARLLFTAGGERFAVTKALKADGDGFVATHVQTGAAMHKTLNRTINGAAKSAKAMVRKHGATKLAQSIKLFAAKNP